MPSALTNPRFAAIVLAAGEASRFGSAKQVALYKGKALVLHAVDAALVAGCQRVIVVTGAHAGDVQQVLAQALPHKAELSLVHNPNWPEGMSSSITAGATALLAEGSPLEAAFVTLADQPLVDAALLTQLAAARRSHRADAAALAYPSGPGVPACFGGSALPLLTQLNTSVGGAKALLRGDALRVVTVDAPAARRDVDTLADWHDLAHDSPPDRP